MNNKLGGMLLLVARNLSSKSNFSGYTWKQDMVSESLLTCVKYLKNFNPDKSQNAFAYVTQIIKNSFKLYITEQKKHSKIKDMCYKGYETYQNETRDIVKYQVNASLNYETILPFVKDELKDIPEPDIDPKD
jgi:DNA-directed RNA polymerase specialized sigma24 family protein